MLDKAAAVLYIITFCFSYYRLFICPKSNQTHNGIVWIWLTLILEVCGQGLFAGIINAFHVPVNLWSMSLINILIGLIVMAVQKKKKSGNQKYYYKKFDIFFCLGLLIVGLYFLLSFKGKDLNLVFYNSDASVHFKNTMAVVRDQALPTMYFSELWTAMVIHCVIPFFSEVNAYKAFVFMDWFYYFLEIVMFTLIIREYADDIKTKVISVLFTVVYALGYPMLGYLYSFLYWGLGIMLMGALLLIVKYQKEKKLSYGFSVVSMMVLCNAVTMCYMLFGPFVFVALAICLTYQYFADNKKLDLQWLKMCFEIFLLPTAIAVYYCYFQFLAQQSLSVGGVMNIAGGAYPECYIHFIWLLVPFAAEVYYCIRNKKPDETMIFSICAICVVSVLAVLYFRQKIGYYYFSKYFYVLWFVLYVDAFKGTVHLLKEHGKAVAGYYILAVLAVLLFEGKNSQLGEARMVDVYQFNLALYRGSYVQCPPEFLEPCRVIMEELPEDAEVPLIAEQNLYSTCYWYEGITGKNSSAYYTWFRDINEIKQDLSNGAVPYFAVLYNSSVYQENADFINQFPCVNQNGVMGIYATGAVQ